MSGRPAAAPASDRPRFQTREQLHATLRKFKDAPRQTQELVFPPTLTTLERRNIHELCEALGGLGHESKDSDAGRFIRVFRHAAKGEQQSLEAVAGSAQTCDDIAFTASQRNAFAALVPDDVHVQAPDSANSGDEAGAGAVAAADSADSGDEAGAGAVAAPERKNKKKKKKKPAGRAGNAAAAETASGEDADLAFLNSIDTSKCPAALSTGRPCGATVALLGQICSHCKNKYCLAHSQPEVHGCGDDAKRRARAEWQAAHERRDGREGRSKAPDWLHGHLQAKLERAIGAAEQRRSRQRPASSSGSGPNGRGGGAGGRGGKS